MAEAERAEASAFDPPLAPRECSALRATPQAGAIRMKAFCAAVGISLGTGTYVVDKLTARGLLERARPESDRRAVGVALTAAGRAARARLMAAQDGICERFLQSLPPGEQATLRTILGRLGATAAAGCVPQRQGD
ncbi:MarR family winged helix-turn-helix transcriptional regulator [Rubrimonas sp.]|uniref:MarR family winged helix-turn-helix transcriptional regulator n=1 Tax=Rubrimonas sp. TaxID=2036015 RepID=UPI002FDCDA37